MKPDEDDALQKLFCGWYERSGAFSALCTFEARRGSVVSLVLTGGRVACAEQTVQVTYDKVREVRAVSRGFGLWGDMVRTLPSRRIHLAFGCNPGQRQKNCVQRSLP